MIYLNDNWYYSWKGIMVNLQFFYDNITKHIDKHVQLCACADVAVVFLSISLAQDAFAPSPITWYEIDAVIQIEMIFSNDREKEYLNSTTEYKNWTNIETWMDWSMVE